MADAAEPTAPRHRVRGSVRWRITLVVMLVFGMTLSLAGYLFVNRVESSLVEKIKEADRAELERVSGLIRSGDPVPAVLPPLPNRPNAQVQVLGPNGEVVASTPGLQGQGSLLAQPPPGAPPPQANGDAPAPNTPAGNGAGAPRRPVPANAGAGNQAPTGSAPSTVPGQAKPPPAGSPGGPNAQGQAANGQPPPSQPSNGPLPPGQLPPGQGGRPGQPQGQAQLPPQSRPGQPGPAPNERPPIGANGQGAPPASVTPTSAPPATDPSTSAAPPSTEAAATPATEAGGPATSEAPTTASTEAPATTTPTTTRPGPAPQPGADYAFTRVPVSTQGGEVDLVAVSPLADVKASVDALSHFLWIVIPALVLFIGVTAWFLTGRALRPVAAMTRRVDDISASTLHERVPVPSSDDEIAHLARTMNRMLERLEQASSRQKQFVSDASHELRSPVSSIRTEMEVALLHPAHTDWDEVARNVLAEDERLERIVTDLLMLARLDEQGAIDTVTDVDLDEVVESEVTRTRRLPVTATGLQPARVSGRPEELGRMVGHLLDNAARHGQRRVEVEVDAGSNGHVRLHVDDDGPGVPPELRDAVFERFGRLQEGRSRDSGGAGLGLAVVKRIAERHGGSVTVGDSPLGGARFEVTLPRSS